MEEGVVDRFFDQQLIEWQAAGDNYRALASIKTKEFTEDGYTYRVQFNPSRIISSTAKIDNKSISERKCFLCPENRPAGQRSLPFGERYQILVNPFPIFPRHFTIADSVHTPQRIKERFADMLNLAEALSGYIIFYNGPRCGASAPDHAHFQAGSKGFLPIEKEWEHAVNEKLKINNHSFLGFQEQAPRRSIIIKSASKADAVFLFHTIYNAMPANTGEEPLMNLLCWHEDQTWTTLIFPRSKHRPDCYAAPGEENMLISPASVDMGGVFIIPLEKDFNKISARHIVDILSEVCISSHDFIELKKQIKESL